VEWHKATRSAASALKYRKLKSVNGVGGKRNRNYGTADERRQGATAVTSFPDIEVAHGRL
jgi:hypothetical protein